MTIPSSFGAGVGLGLGGRIAVYGRRIIVLFRSSWFSFLLPDLNLITSHAHDSIRWIDISGLRSSNCGTGLPLLFACFSFQSIFWFRDFVLEDGIRTPLHFPALSKFSTVSVRSGERIVRLAFVVLRIVPLRWGYSFGLKRCYFCVFASIGLEVRLLMIDRVW